MDTLIKGHRKIILLIIPLFFLVLLISNRASAFSGADWQAGRIIDDFTFTNASSMSPDDIQIFLNTRVPFCDTNGTKLTAKPKPGGGFYTRAEWGTSIGYPPPYTCLRDFYEVPKTAPSVGRPSNNYGGIPIPKGARSAAQIISDSSRAYNISPKVLLVTIEKESYGPLTSDDWPYSYQYQYPLGAQCPDGPNGANCDPNYEGFSIQVYESARLLRYYLDNMSQSWWPYKKPFQTNTILYQITSVAGCGSSSVYIETAATAALYTYTPYQPNTAALSNLYGLGDRCSAYGNRNFWRIYRDWFGPTFANDTDTPHPNGTLVSDASGVYTIDGATKRNVNPWAFISNNYQWSQVKPMSSGDKSLVVGVGASSPALGTLFYAEGSPLYVMEYDGPALVKRHVSLDAFTNLGYKWEEALYVPMGSIPPVTHSSLLYGSTHPSGTLIVDPSLQAVQYVDKGVRRYVSPIAFQSNNFLWTKVKRATVSDLALPIGAALDIKTGTIINANGLYVIDNDSLGAYKRPVGPWECYADRWRYNTGDWITAPLNSLPTRTGVIATC